jgi:phosphoribosyl 1,2-cyclic phosphate phosphodiesterase
VDVSPDMYMQALTAQTDMYDVETVLVTHSHSDHFNLPALFEKRMSQLTNGERVEVALSKPARDYAEKAMALLDGCPEHLHFTGLDYFHEYAMGGLSVRTVKANHDAHGIGEQAINYLLGLPGARTLLYTCDTGYYGEETWDYLRGVRVQTLVMECTFAGRTDRDAYPKEHQDLRSFAKMLDRMASIGVVDAGTAIYATHFNPHQGLSHHEIDKRLAKIHPRASAAYDGLRVEA